MVTLKNINVKDILQSSRSRSNYEMLMSEIRDLVLHEKKEDEQIHARNGRGIGKSAFNSCPMKDVMYSMYLPGRGDGLETHDKKDESIVRHESFGKRINADKNGSRMKKMIYSANCSSRVDPPIDRLNCHHTPRQDAAGDKVSILDTVNIYEALVEAPVSTEMQQVKACMSYLNKIRLHLKKRNFELSLFTLRRHFDCIDKGKGMNLDEFMKILRRVSIHLDPKRSCLLLDKFGLMDKHGMVDYNEALKLLYWKCEMPPLVMKKQMQQKKMGPEYC